MGRAELPVSRIKAAIRSVTRFLQREGVSDVDRTSKQGQLSELQAMLAVGQRKKKEQKLSIRYHAVRFFERKKVERHIRSLQKKVLSLKSAVGTPASSDAPAAAADGRRKKKEKRKTGEQQPSPLEEATKELEAWNRKWLYVHYFPRTRKYVALFRESTVPCDMTFVDAVEHPRDPETGFLVLTPSEDAEDGGGRSSRDGPEAEVVFRSRKKESGNRRRSNNSDSSNNKIVEDHHHDEEDEDANDEFFEE